MARSNPRPPKSKRPPGPLLPGGFFLFGLLLVAILAVALFPWGSSSSVRYDEFSKLLAGNKLKKIVLVGTDRARVEIKEELKKEPDDEIRKLKITGGQFTVMLPPAPD